MLVRLSLADGGALIDLNPAAIAYLQRIPSAEQGQEKTKLVLLTGETLWIKQAPRAIVNSIQNPPKLSMRPPRKAVKK